MNVADAIEQRRAVKAFDPKHTMSEAEIERLMALAMLSPTAFNIQNWRFVLVGDAALRKEIRAVAWDQAQVTDASMLVILTADLRAWEKAPERYWANAPQATRDYLLPALRGYYEGKEQVQRDEAMRSCGMAATSLMLAAQEMGYQSCPMDGFDFAAVAKLIDLPADHVVAMFVAIGKGIAPPYPRGGQLGMNEVLVRNRFTAL